MDGRDVRSMMLRMHRGDELAAETLWAHFASRLTAYARVLLPNGYQFAAEDVVQGVFIRVLKMHRRHLRRVEDGTAFLFRVTRNEAINAGRGELRERARRRAVEQREDGVGACEDVRRVLAAIEGLAYEQREVILLRYIGGLTIGQVSEALGVNRNTVASRGRLGMEKLRAELGVDLRIDMGEVRDG